MGKGNHDPFIFKLSELLLRYHRYLGLDHEQYLLLNSCIQIDDLQVIEEITGFSEEVILSMLGELMEQNIIEYAPESGIDLERLFHLLQAVEKKFLPFREILIREMAEVQENKRNQHIGQVELIPMKKGIAVRLTDGKLLSKKKTKELSEELLNYLAYMEKKENIR